MSADRKGFGGRLRAARERRGVSLREISSKTKISIGVLEALERDDFSRLPGGIFSRAFIRSYAIEVGLDPEEMIQAFLTEFPRNAAATAAQSRSEAIEDGEALESERRVAVTFLQLIGISIPLIGLVLYFTGQRRAGTEQPEAPAPQETSRATTVSPVAEPASSLTPPAAAASSPPIAEQKDVRTAPASEPAPPVPRPVQLEPPAAAEPEPAPSQRPAAAVPSRTAVPAAEPASAPAEQLTVTISTSRPCWVSATVDGANTFERLLQPGESRTFEVRRELVLKAGDAAAISLTLNGAPARPLGNDGEVVTAHLTTSNFKEFLLPQ